MAETLDDIMEVGSDIDGSSKVDGFKAKHKDVVGYWNTQIKAAEAKGADNRKDAAEAESFYRGDPLAWKDDATWTGPETQENVFYRDVMVMSGQLLYTDPKAVVSSNRSKDFKAFAKATQNFDNYVIKEQGYKSEIKRALIQAIFRNYACVHHYWDPHRQLPEIQWCANEVYPDVDCQGDIRRADWIIEEFFPSLDEMLADPEINDEVKKKLAEHPQAYRYPGKDGDSEAEGGDDGAEGEAPEVDTKADPSRIKLRAFKIWSKRGIAPNLKAKALLKKAKGKSDERDGEEDGEDGEEREGDDDAPKAAPTYDHTERLGYGLPQDPNPDDQEEYNDSIEEGAKDKLCITIVENFPLVLKATEWPLNFFDCDEWPISILSLTQLPGDIYGVSLFKVLRPLLRVINFIMSFWFADVRESCRRDILLDEDALAEVQDENGGAAQFGTGEHNKIIKTKKGRNKDAVHVQEYTPRQDGPIARLLEITRRGHDDTSGVNDMARGSTGDVEKTKAEAMLLSDRASESIGIIVDAVDDFLRDIVRKTTMCLHTYVEKTSVYGKCKACAGKGAKPSTELEGQSLAGPDLIPCEACGGSGQSDKAIHKGADFFLTEDDAEAWRDDLSLEKIRAEIIVDVEPGSTRRTNQERRQYQLLQLFNTIGPILEKHGCWRAYGELIRRIAMGTEVPDAESLAPTPDEWDEAVQVAEQLRQMAAQPPPPAPPPTDPAVVANINAKAMLEKARMDAAINLRKIMLEHEVKLRELAIKEKETKIREDESARQEAVGVAEMGMKEREIGVKEKESESRGALEEKRFAMDSEKQMVESENETNVKSAIEGIFAKIKEIEEAISDSDLRDPMLDAANEAVDAVGFDLDNMGYEEEDAPVRPGEDVPARSREGAEEIGNLTNLIEANQKVSLQLISEIQSLSKIMAAPARVVRDARGRATHAVRDMGPEMPRVAPAPMRAKEKESHNE